MGCAAAPESPPNAKPFDPDQTCKISLMSIHGRFLYVNETKDQESNWSQSALTADDSRGGTKFLCYPVNYRGAKSVVLQSPMKQKWVTVEDSDPNHPTFECIIHKNNGIDHCIDRAVFEVVESPDGSIGLKSKYNLFMSADETHKLGWKPEFGFNEQWTVVVHEYVNGVHYSARPEIINEVDSFKHNNLAYISGSAEDISPGDQIIQDAPGVPVAPTTSPIGSESTSPQYGNEPVYTAATVPDADAPPAYDLVMHIPPAHNDTSGMMEGAEGGIGFVVEAVERGHEVKEFLNGIEPFYVDQYFQLLVDNGFDTMQLLRTLSDEDLEKVGVSMMGHRRRILMECKQGTGTGPVTLQ